MEKKEKILIFRTAKMQVVDLLMEQINKNNDITFLVQSNMVDVMKKKYPYTKIISIRENYFDYESFCRKVKLDEKFDTVYVLASGMTFGGYDEVFSILEKIKHRKLILFNGKGEEKVERHSIGNIFREYVFSAFAWIYLKGIDIWYEYFGKKYKF